MTTQGAVTAFLQTRFQASLRGGQPGADDHFFPSGIEGVKRLPSIRA